MPWDFGAGIAAAAGAGASLMGDSIKRERDLQGTADLEALKAKIEGDKRAAVAAVVNSVSRTKGVQIAGPTEDGSSLGIIQQPKSESEYRREVGDKLQSAGFIEHAEKAYTAADRHEENMLTRKTQEAKQKSDDEKWHASQAQAERFHKDTLRMQMANLNLKQQDAKDFSTAVDSYIENKASYDSAVAQNATDEVRSRLKQDVERDALKLKQFRVDVGDQSDLAKHMNLSASLTALNKTIEAKTMSNEDVTAEKASRDSIVKQMAAIAGRGGDGGSADVQFEMVDGKLVRKGAAKPAAPAGGAKPAVAAVGGGIVQQPSYNDAGYGNIDNTIAGAKRGDRKAVALLKNMLDEGGLTAQQAAQVRNL